MRRQPLGIWRVELGICDSFGSFQSGCRRMDDIVLGGDEPENALVKGVLEWVG